MWEGFSHNLKSIFSRGKLYLKSSFYAKQITKYLRMKKQIKTASSGTKKHGFFPVSHGFQKFPPPAEMSSGESDEPAGSPPLKGEIDKKLSSGKFPLKSPRMEKKVLYHHLTLRSSGRMNPLSTRKQIGKEGEGLDCPSP